MVENVAHRFIYSKPAVGASGVLAGRAKTTAQALLQSLSASLRREYQAVITNAQDLTFGPGEYDSQQLLKLFQSVQDSGTQESIFQFMISRMRFYHRDGDSYEGPVCLHLLRFLNDCYSRTSPSFYGDSLRGQIAEMLRQGVVAVGDVSISLFTEDTVYSLSDLTVEERRSVQNILPFLAEPLSKKIVSKLGPSRSEELMPEDDKRREADLDQLWYLQQEVMVASGLTADMGPFMGVCLDKCIEIVRESPQPDFLVNSWISQSQDEDGFFRDEAALSFFWDLYARLYDRSEFDPVLKEKVLPILGSLKAFLYEDEALKRATSGKWWERMDRSIQLRTGTSDEEVEPVPEEVEPPLA